jgi:hypothetical protein
MLMIVVDVALHRARRVQPIQSVHDEERIPQPAETIVPGAPARGCLGQRRGDRRDDRAGVLVDREVQRDRRADDLLLPLERIDSPRTQSRQYSAVCSRNERHTSATEPCSVSSGPEDEVDFTAEQERTLLDDGATGQSMVARSTNSS